MHSGYFSRLSGRSAELGVVVTRTYNSSLLFGINHPALRAPPAKAGGIALIYASC